MTFGRGVLSVFAAVFGALFTLFILESMQHPHTAIGFDAVFESVLLSPRFWGIAVLFVGLLFLTNLLKNKALRVLLFWIPSVTLLLLGLGVCALYGYIWLHFRNM
ncbi:MAG TPA: hypothetical protein VFA90_19490 [Terriglobales bacterium]|nr:hypothetical protein [Terriglobales bacterium]